MAQFADPRLPQRFWNKIIVSPDGCWVWTAAKDWDGYARFGMGERNNAHRIAYETLIGPIPDGLEPDHLCRNRACVNPDHLDIVTHRVNVERGRAGEHMASLSRSITHCPKGHPYDSTNTYIDKLGHRSCKLCKLERNRAHVDRALEWQKTHRLEVNQRNRERRKENPEKHRSANREYYHQNIERMRAIARERARRMREAKRAEKGGAPSGT